jgi:hypothetical protein
MRTQFDAVIGFCCFSLAALVTLGLGSMQFAQEQPRVWTDATGTHKTEATVLRTGPGYVHLLRNNGRVVEVPLDRLSAADRQFVLDQAESNEQLAANEAEQRFMADIGMSPATSLVNEGPDLDVLYISREPGSPGLHGKVEYPERLPKLKDGSADLERFLIKPGTATQFTTHIANRGTAVTGEFSVAWQIDGNPAGTIVRHPGLRPDETAEFQLSWVWEDGTHLVKVDVTPVAPVQEICLTNNSREETIQGAGFVIGMTREFFDAFRQHANMVGSRSPEDWVQWHIDCMNRSFANSRYPSTPRGSRFRVRVDQLFVSENVDEIRKIQDQFSQTTQGNWPLSGDYKDRWGQPDWGLIHELGHQLGLIDLYQMNGSPQFCPVVDSRGDYLNATYVFPTPKLMMHWHGPHPWSELHAAALDFQVLSNGQQTPRGFYGDFLYHMCESYRLQIVDTTGSPIGDAQIELFPQQFDKKFLDKPTTVGQTDANGVWEFPNRQVGTILTTGGFQSRPNPYGTIDVVGANALMMLRFTRGDHQEVRILNITEFVVPAFRGEGEHTIIWRTRMGPANGPPKPTKLAVTFARRSSPRLRFECPEIRLVKELRIYESPQGVPAQSGFEKLAATVSPEEHVTLSPNGSAVFEVDLPPAGDGRDLWVCAVDKRDRVGTSSSIYTVPAVVGASGLTVAPDGTWYLSDAHPHTGRIMRLKGGQFDGSNWQFRGENGGEGRMLGLAIHLTYRSDLAPYHIVAANNYSHRVHFFRPNGDCTAFLGSQKGTEPGQFDSPSGVAIGPEGEVFVSDTGNRRVQVFSADGQFLRQFNGAESGDGNAALKEPYGVAVTPNNECLVADRKDACVKRFSLQGEYRGTIGATVLQDPLQIVVRSVDGLIAVSDVGRNAVYLFDKTGALQGEHKSSDTLPFARPSGVVFDEKGDLCFVADEFEGQLIRQVPLPRKRPTSAK